jgi:O-antigen/teichoic acid export membrane protein
MIDERFNLRRNVWYAIVELVANVGLVFLTYRLVILQGGITAVGLWATLYAWAALIRVGDVGISAATTRFVALHDIRSEAEAARRFVETGIISNALVFGLLCLAGYFVLYQMVDIIVSAEHSVEAKGVLPVLLLGFMLFNIWNIVIGCMQGLHLGYVRSQLSIGGSLLQLVVAVLLVPTNGILGLAWAQVAQYGAVSIVGWLIVRQTVGIRSYLPSRLDLPTLREMLGFSLTSQAANVASGLFEPVSKIAVGQVAGLHVQGLYELAYKSVWLPRTAIIAGAGATTPALTAIFRSTPDAVTRIYRRTSRLSTLAVAGCMLLITLASPVISLVWIGHIDWQYVAITMILAVGVFFNAFGAAAYNLAAVTGQMRNNIAVNAIVLLVLALGFVLGRDLPPIGLVAIVATAMAFGGVAVKLLNERYLA